MIATRGGTVCTVTQTLLLSTVVVVLALGLAVVVDIIIGTEVVVTSME